jgi:peptidoglycan/xylan/chitin deacetylase (PgdA/CDA1 family)
MSRRRRPVLIVVPAIVAAVAATVAIVSSGGGGPSTRTRSSDVPPAQAVPPARAQPPAATATQPPATGPAPPIAASPPARDLGFVEHGPRTARRLVALTFDADMTPLMLARLRAGAVHGWYDRSIVDYLRATHTPATIFLTGLWAKTYPGVVNSLAQDRLFELENHSYDHSAFEPQCYGLGVVAAPDRKRSEIVDATAAIVAAGAPIPRYFRFPGGCHNAADLRLIASEGERPVGWDVVSGDPFQPDPAPVVRAVESGAQPGSIVVMHIMGAPNAPATAAALRQIVPALRARGLRFATLRQVLRG